MTMICKICTHPKKLNIDREIVSGGNLTNIAKKYGLPYNSLYNHAQNHLSRQLVQSFKTKELDHSTDLLTRIDQIVDRCELIFTRNYDKGKDVTALKALSEQRSTFELIAKISYALHEAKKLEAQQSKDQIIQELKEQQSASVEEQLEILTKEEQQLYLKLVNKMLSKNSAIKVVPEESNIFTQLTEDQPLKRTKWPKKQQIEPISEPEKPYQGVKPITPIQIPETRWADNPLNPRRSRTFVIRGR